MRTQCKLLGVARSSVAYRPKPPCPQDRALMRVLDELYLRDPCLGSRRLAAVLERDYGQRVNRKRLQRLRRLLGQEAIYCKPRTSAPGKGHRVYPYLLREQTVSHPDEVWCADITYIPMPKGHAYLCAVMDWYSRRVLGWAVSNTLDTSFCLEALKKAVRSAGCVPQIFNTDQGSQFTSEAWTGRLAQLGVRISMDGKGRWMDNVFIERLWRSLKHEEVYLRDYANVRELERGLDRWMERYNHWRPHQALGNQTPQQWYRPGAKVASASVETHTKQAA